MYMRVVALFEAPSGRFARLRATGKAWYAQASPMMCLLDVKNEERGLKLGQLVDVQFSVAPALPVLTQEALPAQGSSQISIPKEV